MWIQKRQRDKTHYLHSKAVSGDEQNVDLYMTFVDPTKALLVETDCRDGLWKIMAKFGCPPRFIAMVRQFHDGLQATACTK